MAHLDDRSLSNEKRLASLDEARLRRFLPPSLADDLVRDLADMQNAPARQLEAFVHLVCARSAVAGYIPRFLSDQLLHQRLASPWLRWAEGSLLFADLSGSTALAEQLSTLGREGTELVTACLNQVFTALLQVITDYGGDLVTFGGDALLVFFGDDRHPRTAARAALALQLVMLDYVQVVPNVGSFPMHLHVGIESGRVAFFSAGTGDQHQYGVLGGVVNRVADAESRARPGEVVVGPHAWETLVYFAQANALTRDFYRINAMRAPRQPHLPLPDEVIDAAPEEAIPQLLDDLDKFSPYVPRALLSRILAEPQLPQVEADLRPVSVLFAQVVGLETLAETLAEADAANAVQTYVGAMQAAIDQYGGVLNKIDVADEGIKLVAVFGAPTAFEDHAERAARAALDMQSALAGVNEQIRVQGSAVGEQQSIAPRPLIPALRPLRQRIGLNLGTAFAGNVGSTTRKEYTVMGDAVNVAARVMTAAGWDEIWCSAATTRAVESRIMCEDRGFLTLKGKAQPVQLFQLTAARETAVSPRVAEGPLIGRDDEAVWLRAHLDATLAGNGHAARISGEAGVGKSRLAAALVAEADSRNMRVVSAACLSYTASIPYAAWGEWLKCLCDIGSGDDDAMRERKLADQLAQLGPGIEEWLPLLGDLARLDVPENRLTRGLDPQMRQTRRFELLEELLYHAAETEPLLVLFEDLHWADPISLTLWRRVAANLAGRPILLVGVHRPLAVFDEDGDNADVLALKELSAEQSSNLASSLAGDAVLPAPVVEKLVERAAGNPLFLGELMNTVKQRIGNEQSAAELRSSAATATTELLDDLPDSLNGLLLSRIDRLDENSRGVLRIASVIGQRIPFGVLHAIQNNDQAILLRDLARLDAENMTLLERLDPPERVHTFRHALIQEVAYQSMLYARRRELHGRIGNYLERRYGDDLDDYYGLLAHHYRHSDQRDKAVEYLLKAGNAAQAVYANNEALQYFGWALEALGEANDVRAWQTRDALGDVYTAIGRYDDALAHYAAILVATGATPDAIQRSHRKRGNVLEKQGQYIEAQDELHQAMLIARSNAADVEPLAVPLINADLGLVHQRRGEFDLAIACCEEGLAAMIDIPDVPEDEKIEARLRSTLGAIYGRRGDYARARTQFEYSLMLRSEIDDLAGVTVSHNNLGYLWQLQGEYERALDHYKVAENLAKKINMRYALVHAAGNAAYTLLCLGSYAAAEERCTEALTLAHELQAQHDIAQLYNTLGIIFYQKGGYDRALQSFQDSRDRNEMLGSAYQVANAEMHAALALSAQQRFQEAADIARVALERAETLNASGLQAEAHNALAEALLGLDDPAAVQHARTAEQLSREIGSKLDLGIAQRLLGIAAFRSGTSFDHAFQSSIEIFNTIKNRFELGRTWAVYGVALLESGNKIDGETYLKQARDTFMSIGAEGELLHLSRTTERST